MTLKNNISKDHPDILYGKTGVLIINLGTPEATDWFSIRKYLKELLSDRRIIEVNRILWFLILNLIILTFRQSKNSKEYLKHSIEQNKSLEKTIDKLKELEGSDNVKPSVRKALETHQENMNRILNEYEIPSEKASEAVGSSYAVMAETLTKESGVLAGAMMKNMA